MSTHSSAKARATTKVTAASGRLRNDYFLLTADHLLLEVDTASFQLVSAIAEGSIQIHTVVRESDKEYIIYAQSAVYQPTQSRVIIRGWQGTRENGVHFPPVETGKEIFLPTDGGYYFPIAAENAELEVTRAVPWKKAA